MNFLNPFFLFGLAALGLPILIHLVKRERAQRLYFSSLRFLRPISQRTLKYLRLQNLFLMLLRMLALLLVVLAFARPYFPKKEMPSAERARSMAILVDNSLSMGYADHLAKAKRAALALIDTMRPNDKAIVAAVSSQWDQRTQLTSEKAVLKSAIDRIAVTPNTTDYLLALGSANHSLMEAGADREKIIHLISDFHKTGFRGDTDFQLASGVTLEPHDIAPAASTNLTIAEVDFVKDGKIADAGKVTARIANFGGEQKAITAKLFLNGREIGRRDAKVEPASTQNVTFENVALLPGASRGKVELIDDPLPLDNSYFFVIDTARRVKILLVNNARDLKVESLFIERALGVGGSMPFALTVRRDNELKPDDLMASDLVILNGVDSLPAQILKTLRAAVEQGQGVLFSAGPHMEAATFNRTFSGIAPARLQQVKSTHKPQRDPLLLTSIKGDHPIFQPFSEQHTGNFSASMYSSILVAEPQSGSAILARFDDGSPVLIESKVGRGIGLLYTSTLGDSWNNLPLNPVYLPLLHQIVKYAGSASQEKGSYVIGETVPLERIVPIPLGDMLPEKILVNGPDGERVRVTDGLIPIKSPGFYEVRSEKKIKYLAANPNIIESDLRKMDTKELLSAVTKATATGSESAKDTMSADAVEQRQGVWWYVLLAALLILCAEAILANRWYQKKR